MKATTRHIVALFLSTLIFFQGCSVYKSANVTLEEAVRAETKGRIIKKNGKKIKFLKVVFEDGQYKSIEKLGGGTVKTQIEVDKIEKVQFKDKVLSIILPIGIYIILIGVGSKLSPGVLVSI
ncbi:MAG: hypothetical protein DRI75_09640 [Bacteroidetes bacterium]|nr:MAG: hypothetical protein DRI75_09640 [Bacteroidota bacterium]